MGMPHGALFGEIRPSLSAMVTDMCHRSFETHRTVVQDVPSNSFCASGMHLPNGSWATFGGNDAVTVGGAAGSDKNPDGTGNWDNLLQDHDGRRAIRVVNPCTIQDNLDGNNCKWYDHFAEDGMKRARWYSTSEATGDGRIVIIGGMVRGGFINRQFPVTDPITQNGQSEPTYEYFPPKAEDPPRFQFLIDAGGLNTYPHTFLMPDGRFFVQANLSSSTSPPFMCHKCSDRSQFSGITITTGRPNCRICRKMLFVFIPRLVGQPCFL